jgi:hypothetical protein
VSHEVGLMSTRLATPVPSVASDRFIVARVIGRVPKIEPCGSARFGRTGALAAGVRTECARATARTAILAPRAGQIAPMRPSVATRVGSSHDLCGRRSRDVGSPVARKARSTSSAPGPRRARSPRSSGECVHRSGGDRNRSHLVA